MAQPTPYERQYNFSNYQGVNPSDPLPGAQVDNELNAAKASLDETQANLALIQRDDGQLKNNSVGFDQLKEEVEIGVNPPSAWVTLTNYAVADTVTKDAGFYRCKVAHISGTFATDLAAGKWELIVDFSDAISSSAIEDALHNADSKAEPVDGDEFLGNDSADSYTIRRFNWANIKATMFAAIGTLLDSATGKTTPVDADTFAIGDSAATNATKKLTFANLATTLFTGLGAKISAATGKTTPVDADSILLSDSADSNSSKKLTIANLKALVSTALGPTIAALTGKTTPVDADSILLSDSAASDVSKKVTFANLKATLKTYFDTLYGTVDYPPGHLHGLTLSNNGTDAANDIDIAAGSARDDTDTDNMVLASTLTKQLDAAWAVGTGQGGLDTGAIADTTYHVFLIKRSDTGVVDVLFSTSATSPTMPTSYDYKRRIGSIVRTSGAIRAFVQDGDQFTWSVPVQDVNAANPGTSAVNRTLSVPTGIRVRAKITVVAVMTTASTDAPGGVFISDPSLTDTAASGLASTLNVSLALAAAANIGAQAEVYTNTSAQVRSRLQASAAGTTLLIDTNGWVDARGRE